MTDHDILRLVSKLGEIFATKEDLKNFATKDDIENVREDIVGVKENLTGVKEDLRKLEIKLETKIDNLDKKFEVLLTYIDGVDEVTTDHEKRLKKIESIPVVSQELNPN